MAIPKYNEMYRVFLDCLADMQPHRSKEVRDSIAARLSVSCEERQVTLSGGRQTIFDNRVGWTRTYLKKAGLITSLTRGVYQLTELGKKILDSNPAVIDNSFLEQFESFQQFIHAEPALKKTKPAGKSGWTNSPRRIRYRLSANQSRSGRRSSVRNYETNACFL